MDMEMWSQGGIMCICNSPCSTLCSANQLVAFSSWRLTRIHVTRVYPRGASSEMG
jgi:hypothetical protein